jgi:hypothetical protein
MKRISVSPPSEEKDEDNYSEFTVEEPAAADAEQVNVYLVDEYPPWHVIVLSALQVCLLLFKIIFSISWIS